METARALQSLKASFSLLRLRHIGKETLIALGRPIKRLNTGIQFQQSLSVIFYHYLIHFKKQSNTEQQHNTHFSMYLDVNQTCHGKCQTPGKHTEIELGAGGDLTQCGGDWTSSLAFLCQAGATDNPKFSCQMLMLSKIAFQVKTGRR